LHKESHLLIPSEPPSNDKINTDDTVESAHDHDERLLLIDTDGQEDCGLESQIPDCEGLSFGSGEEGGGSVDVSIPLEHETLKEMPPSSLDLDSSFALQPRPTPCPVSLFECVSSTSLKINSCGHMIYILCYC